jgi:tetratricopeptide (TPR) repeat protein
LDPEEYFNLGDFLRARGRTDEAVDAHRNGVRQAQDQVLVSNSVQPPVEYDYAHGQQDEAMQLAKQAAEVYSADGIETYIWLLCKLNQFDEAEQWAQKLQDRYGGANLSFFCEPFDDFKFLHTLAHTFSARYCQTQKRGHVQEAAESRIFAEKRVGSDMIQSGFGPRRLHFRRLRFVVVDALMD